jgi:hypothetical protein
MNDKTIINPEKKKKQKEVKPTKAEVKVLK